MSLDPVHFKAITELADRIDHSADLRDHRELALSVWEEQLDPLTADGDIVLEPLDTQRCRKADIEEIALSEDVFETRHGLDSGTINPTTFKNGIVVDVAQAAMSAVPTDTDLHRSRTIVMTTHSNDDTAMIADQGGWRVYDEGYTKKRVLHAPRVSQYESAVVHELALYLAESERARETAGDVVEDLLILDGPIYPKGLLNWPSYGEPELEHLLDEETQPRSIVESYIRLIEEYKARDVPLVGFVKTPLSRSITRQIRERSNSPWVNDAAFFSQVLEPFEGTNGSNGDDRDRSVLTFTDWFISRSGADRMLSTLEDAFGIERTLAPEAYEVTFCVIYDPRDDVVYRLEAPAVFTHDADRREELTKQVLKGVATQQGPPPAVAKADSLARIGHRETQALQDGISEAIDAEQETNYNTQRVEQWGLEF